MGTLVSEQVQVSVNVMERSVTATANWVIQCLLRVVKQRGLGPDYLIGNRQILEAGLFTWLGEQKLEGISIEVYRSNREEALERFDIEFTYSAQPDLTVRNPNVARLEEVCRKLRHLPAGAEYRVIASTAEGASDVPGWVPTAFRPLTVENEYGISRHGYGHIASEFVYRGGRW